MTSLADQRNATTPAPSTASNIAAVVLAAGQSQRYGKDNKLLADINGAPLIRHVLSRLSSVRLYEIVVVTGWDAKACAEALSGFQIRFTYNDGWRHGMGTSIASGVAAVDNDTDGVMIVPADMPSLTSQYLQSLIQAFDDGATKKIVVPRLPDGTQVNPVVWPKRYFGDLMNLPAERGAKELITRNANDQVSVAVDDAVWAEDLDTQDDYARIKYARSARNNDKGDV